MPKRPSRLRDRSWWWWKFVSPKYELHGGSGINCQARGRCYLPSLCYVFPLYRMTFMYQERNLLCSISFCLRTPLLLFALRKSLMNCFHNWHLASCGVCECGFVVVLVIVGFFLLTHVGSQNVLNELCLHHWFQYHQLLVVGYTGVTCCGPGLLWQLIPVARACQTISDVVFAGWTHWLWQKSQFVSIWLHILTIHPSSKYKVIIPFMIVCNCVAAYAKKIRISTQRTCTRKHQIICNAEQKLYWLTPVGTSFFITVL